MCFPEVNDEKNMTEMVQFSSEMTHFVQFCASSVRICFCKPLAINIRSLSCKLYYTLLTVHPH